MWGAVSSIEGHGVFGSSCCPAPSSRGQGGHAHLTRGWGLWLGSPAGWGGAKLPIYLRGGRGCGLSPSLRPSSWPSWLPGPAGHAWVTQFWVPPFASRRPRRVIQKLAVPRRPRKGLVRLCPPETSRQRWQQPGSCGDSGGQGREPGAAPLPLCPECFVLNAVFRVSFRLTEVAKVAPRQGVGVYACNPRSSGS